MTEDNDKAVTKAIAAYRLIERAKQLLDTATTQADDANLLAATVILNLENGAIKGDDGTLKTLANRVLSGNQDDWIDCGNVQCRQAHESLNAVMELLSLECPNNIYVVGKAARIASAIINLRQANT